MAVSTTTHEGIASFTAKLTSLALEVDGRQIVVICYYQLLLLLLVHSVLLLLIIRLCGYY